MRRSQAQARLYSTLWRRRTLAERIGANITISNTLVRPLFHRYGVFMRRANFFVGESLACKFLQE